jgi:uncharacterized protein YaaR (DUF327 family)
MNFVFLMLNGNTILSVESVDLIEEDITIEQAAAELAKKASATAYAVLADDMQGITLLQQTKEIHGGKL